MKIYFRTKTKFTDVEELLREGFTPGIRFKETFADINYKIQECHSARRSFGDLLSIVRTYLPRTRETKVAKAIFKLGGEGFLTALYCTTIQKVVFVRKNYYDADDFNYCIYSELREKKGKGKYSFNKIKKLAK